MSISILVNIHAFINGCTNFATPLNDEWSVRPVAYNHKARQRTIHVEKCVHAW